MRMILTKSFRTEFSQSQLLVLDDKNATLLLDVREDIFHMGISSPAFKKNKEGQSVFLVFVVFQVSFTQHNP